MPSQPASLLHSPAALFESIPLFLGLELQLRDGRRAAGSVHRDHRYEGGGDELGAAALESFGAHADPDLHRGTADVRHRGVEVDDLAHVDRRHEVDAVEGPR